MKKRIRTFYKLNDIEINSFTNKSSYDILSRTIFSDKIADKQELKKDIEKIIISLMNEIWVNGTESAVILKILRNLKQQLYSIKEIETKSNPSPNCSVNTNNIIKFGMYNDKPIEWYVVSANDKSMLLVSVNCVARIPFSYEWDGSWKKSYVRTWLNDDFINRAFSKKEINNIVTTKIFVGNKEGSTFDRIFLLDAAEAYTYLSGKLKSDTWWWLRNEVDNKFAYGAAVNENGLIIDGLFNGRYDPLTPNGGVRPAMYIKNII